MSNDKSAPEKALRKLRTALSGARGYTKRKDIYRVFIRENRSVASEAAMQAATSLAGEAHKADDRRGEAYAYSQCALISESVRSNYIDARAFAEQALAIYRDIRDYCGIAQMTRVLAACAMVEGDIQSAEATLASASDLAEEFCPEEEKIPLLTTQVILAWRQGKRAEAREAVERMIGVARTVGDRMSESIGLNNLAVLLRETGSPAEAAQMWWRAYAIKVELGDKAGTAICLVNLASLHQGFSDHATALDLFRQALQLQLEIGSVQGQAHTHHGIAYSSRTLGKTEEALRHLDIAIRRAQDASDKHLELTFETEKAAILDSVSPSADRLADLHRLQKERAMIHDSAGIATCDHFLALAYLRRSQVERAKQHIDAAVARSRGDEHSDTLPMYLLDACRIARRASNYAVAKDVATEALEVAARLEQHGEQRDALVELAEIAEAASEFRVAYQRSRQVMEIEKSAQLTANSVTSASMLARYEVERLRYEAELAQVRAQQLERSLETTQKELSLTALKLVAKSEFLHDLQKQIASQRVESSAFLEDLAKRLSETSQGSEQWDVIEQKFVAVHPGFSRRVQALALTPLSTTELKICALVKIGLSNKEIAGLLFLSARTVENHRYNIHRKLNLGAEKLSGFLSKIEE